MMPESELILTLEGEKALLQKVDRLAPRIREAVGRKALLQSALLLERHIKMEKLSGQVLHVRSGRLRSSISHRLEPIGQDLTARVGTNLVYARIHEFGGTITPKRAANLAIPTEIAKTPAGVPRYTARQLIAAPSRGGFVRTFFRNRKLYGVTRSGKVRAVFVLVKSLTLPERSYMRSSLNEKRAEIIQTISAAVSEALTQA
jgi:phage gpG-like protein